jgi:hypothetical protein
MVGVLVSIAAATVLALYGWRMMRRSNREKAAVLAKLVGQYQVTLHFQSSYAAIGHREGAVLRLEHGMVIMCERPDASNLSSSFVERAYPLTAIREIQQGTARWGPW